MALTRERLLNVLAYDENTGRFTWRVITNNRMKVGQTAGAMSPRGYIQIMIDRSSYKAHRLAWLYVHGEWPPHHIDHINRNPLDNRIANLRRATNAQNAMNTKLSSNNRSGYKGIWWSARMKKWGAQIGARTRTSSCDSKHIGYFPTKEAAVAARRIIMGQLYGEFAV